ncbi:MAG: hypothetical protein ACJ0QO_04470 [Parvicellaceae bacterium]
MTYKKEILIISMIIFSLVYRLNAQEISDEESNNDNIVLVIKNDGGEYIGEIISDDGREILIISKSIGKIFIKKSNISSITKVNSSNKRKTFGGYLSESPFSTRYYFTNNALPIKRNENYALIHLFGPEIQLSVSNTTSVGIMASWIASPIGLALKQQLFSKNKFHMSIGTILGSSGYLEQGRINGGLHWLTMTYGDRISNFSISGGIAHIRWPSVGNSTIMEIQRNLGERNSYSFTDPNHEFYIEDNPFDTTSNSSSYNPYYYYGANYDPRQNALEQELYGENDYSSVYNNNKFIYKNRQVSGVIGISAIAPIGKKASFIFDSMILLRNENKVIYTGTKEVDIDYEVYNYNTDTINNYDQTILVGTDAVISDQKIMKTTLIFMPAIRFSKSYKKAFQVALAGYIDIDGVNGFSSAPVPMVSWLRKF